MLGVVAEDTFAALPGADLMLGTQPFHTCRIVYVYTLFFTHILQCRVMLNAVVT